MIGQACSTGQSINLTAGALACVNVDTLPRNVIMTTKDQARTILAVAKRTRGPAPGRIAAPVTDKVVFQNGVWIIRDTVTGFAYGPFGLKRLADEELAKGRMVAPARRVH